MVMKIERTRIHFFSDVFIAVAVAVKVKVPSIEGGYALSRSQNDRIFNI